METLSDTDYSNTTLICQLNIGKLSIKNNILCITHKYFHKNIVIFNKLCIGRLLIMISAGC